MSNVVVEGTEFFKKQVALNDIFVRQNCRLLKFQTVAVSIRIPTFIVEPRKSHCAISVKCRYLWVHIYILGNFDFCHKHLTKSRNPGEK